MDNDLQEEVVKELVKKYPEYTHTEMMKITSSFFMMGKYVMNELKGNSYRMFKFITFWVKPYREEWILKHVEKNKLKAKKWSDDRKAIRENRN